MLQTELISELKDYMAWSGGGQLKGHLSQKACLGGSKKHHIHKHELWNCSFRASLAAFLCLLIFKVKDLNAMVANPSFKVRYWIIIWFYGYDGKKNPSKKQILFDLKDSISLLEYFAISVHLSNSMLILLRPHSSITLQLQTAEYRHTLLLCHSKAQSTPRKLNHTLNKSQVIANKLAQFTHSQIFAHA